MVTPQRELRLDINECPYALPAHVGASIAKRLEVIALNRYPDSGATELKEAWAKRLGVEPRQLVLGNGSDELIGLVLRSFSRPVTREESPRVLVPSPSFPMFKVISEAHGTQPVELLLNPDFSLPAQALAQAMEEARPKVVFFDRPNNPTGALWDAHLLEGTAAANPGCVVVVDEACADYACESMADRVKSNPNLVVLRSLSKLGLAGLRVGAAVCHPDTAAQLERGRLPFNVGALAQAAAAHVLGHHGDILDEHVRKVLAERERTAALLAGMTRVKLFPSHANYFLLRVKDAQRVWNGLQEKGIFVQRFEVPPALADCLRVTVGTPEQNDIFVSGLSRALDACH